MLIMICGAEGAGKSTLASYLVKKYGFEEYTFASPIKDFVAQIYGWDRNLLEGNTIESRHWRECKINGKVPRQELQKMGDIMKKEYGINVWVDIIYHKVMNHGGNVVISDLRYPHELEKFKDHPNLITIKIEKMESGIMTDERMTGEIMDIKPPKPHPSSIAYKKIDCTHLIFNRSNVQNLHCIIDQIV